MMKTTKADLLEENRRLAAQVSAQDAYLTHAFRGEVTFINKGANLRFGVCGETSAHGGIVLDARKGDNGKWYVVGVYYAERYLAGILATPFRSDDTEGMNLRILANAAATHIRERQAQAEQTRMAVA